MDQSTAAGTAGAAASGAPPDADGADGAAALRARVAELERERDQLVAVVDIQREMAAAPSYLEVLHAITRVLGRSFSLDRCSVYLAGGPGEARLVASFENPAIRNLAVDLARYPELGRVLASGEPVFIADAAQDAALAPARDALQQRNVGAIAVVPMRWRGHTIGAIYLRTHRDARKPLGEGDLRFCAVVAGLAAQALHAAHRGDDAARAPAPPSAADGQAPALLAFVRRLLERHAAGAAAPAPADPRLDELADLTLRALAGDPPR